MDTLENIGLLSFPCSTSELELSSKGSSSVLCATPLSTGSPIRTTGRGGLKNSTLKFLENKHKKEVELEAQKLQLEQKKLEFEKEKFELEKKSEKAS